MKDLKKFYKKEIKEKSLALRELKKEIKILQKKGDYNATTLQGRLHFNRIDMRYVFLAYALVRGKTVESVESNPKEVASESKIQSMMVSMESLFEASKSKEEV